jgi:hypothetical protein
VATVPQGPWRARKRRPRSENQRRRRRLAVEKCWCSRTRQSSGRDEKWPLIRAFGIFTGTEKRETTDFTDGTDRPAMPLPVLPFSSVLSVPSVVVWLFCPVMPDQGLDGGGLDRPGVHDQIMGDGTTTTPGTGFPLPSPRCLACMAGSPLPQRNRTRLQRFAKQCKAMQGNERKPPPGHLATSRPPWPRHSRVWTPITFWALVNCY